jgi:hypothetical protein
LIRLIGIGHLLDRLIACRPEARARPGSLMLSAGLVYYFNSTFTTEPAGDKWDRLRRKLCRRALNEDGEAVPVDRIQGTWFWADIVTNGAAPKVPTALGAPGDLLCSVFDVQTVEDLHLLVGAHGAVAAEPRAPGNPRRTNNRRPNNLTVQDVRVGAPVPRERFDLVARGVMLQPIFQDEPEPRGADLDPESDDEDDDREDHRSIDQIVEDMWTSMPYEVMAQSANERSATAPSYTLLSNAQILQTTTALFNRTDLRGVWDAAYFRVVTEKEWQAICWRLFPDKFFVPTADPFMHYPNMRYWNDWKKVRTRLSLGDVKIVRKELLKRFKTLLWVPRAESDRVWRTSLARKPRHLFRIPPGTANAVSLALNPHVYKESEHILEVGPLPALED